MLTFSFIVQMNVITESNVSAQKARISYVTIRQEGGKGPSYHLMME